MKKVSVNNYEIEIGSIIESGFSKLLADNKNCKKVIIVDENTQQFCLNTLLSNFDLGNAEIIQIPGGEDGKQIEIAASVWSALTEYEIGRKDVIINLGGGMVTDFGGFMASCYKRGVRFVNIPTSLLGMVDASLGGKTGVNLGQYKNQIGLFADPIAVFIDPEFLSTLPEREVLSGFAEMLKHGLIKDKVHFTDVLTYIKDKSMDLGMLIYRSVEIKKEIVDKDPLEAGERKLLNFGHTVGHVLEGINYDDERFTHGYCVAIGMIVETELSFRKGLINRSDRDEVIEALISNYPVPALSSEDISLMISMLSNDKKNENDRILITLIEGIGSGIYNVEVKEEEIEEILRELDDLLT